MPSPTETRNIIKAGGTIGPGLAQNSYNANLRENWQARTDFPFNPAATLAVNTDLLTQVVGTATMVIAKAARGGCNVSTRTSSTAAGDFAGVVGVLGGPFRSNAATGQSQNQVRYATRVMLPLITNVGFAAGSRNSQSANADPDPASETGSSFYFIFDPGNNYSVAATNPANWKLVTTVASVETVQDSGIPVVAGRDYELCCILDADRRPNYYIDGVKVATGPALANAAQLYMMNCIETFDAAPAARAFECRWMAISCVRG